MNITTDRSLLQTRRNITLRQLRAFVAVAQTGSFSLAAESLFVTQSAVSALVKELESVLGLVLIDRSTRRLQLSSVGEDLLPIVAKVLHDLDLALTASADLRSLRQGVVRIAAPQLMSAALLPEVISAYGALHPQVRVKLLDCAVENVTARVFAEEVDIGLGPERENSSDIQAEPLFQGPFMAAFPTGHPLEARERIRWKDLARYPVIALQGQFMELLRKELHATTRNSPISLVGEVTFMSTALAMAHAGQGVALCMPYAAPLAQRYGLVMRPLYQPAINRRFYLFTRRGRTLSPAVCSFMNFLREYVETHPLLTSPAAQARSGGARSTARRRSL